MAGDTR